jgi:hypothetical protein
VKKLAIFVEGQTEQIFVEKLLREIAGQMNISIEIQSQERSKFARLIMKDPITTTTKYYVLIYNSANDNRVASDIKDQYKSLIASGYERIIGLRDVYPETKADVDKGLKFFMTTISSAIPINIVLAVMEVEAWFLAEWNHFIKIDAILTPEKIQADLGFNPKTDDMEARNCPHDDLHRVYQLVGKAYQKKKNQINRTVDNLDYEFIYLELVNNVISLGEFIGYINKFMN